MDRDRVRHWNRVRHRNRDWFRDVYGYRDISPNRVWDWHRDGDRLRDSYGPYGQWKANSVGGLLCSAEIDGLHVVGVALKPTLPAVGRRTDCQKSN
jgi:hypothetical protein